MPPDAVGLHCRHVAADVWRARHCGKVMNDAPAYGNTYWSCGKAIWIVAGRLASTSLTVSDECKFNTETWEIVAMDRSSSPASIREGITRRETGHIFQDKEKCQQREEWLLHRADSLTAVTHMFNVPPHIVNTHWTHQSSPSSKQMMRWCHHCHQWTTKKKILLPNWHVTLLTPCSIP